MNNVAVVTGIVAPAAAQSGFDMRQSDPTLVDPPTGVIGEIKALA
ncbi:MAG: hypothetical protein OXH20_10120 [bacterium]|nr:hypothetical protein [bacterium]MDE0668073.1 hypothetical protein [bacterium]